MSTNKTTNYNLHAWVGTDYVKRVEFNENFATIDTTLKSIDTEVKTKAPNSHVGSSGSSAHPDATTSASGFMPASYVTKLNGIATGAEVNQNTFANVKVGTTTIAADAKQDTLEIVAGTNVTITPDATNDKLTISAVNSTYVNATTTADGLMPKESVTKLNGIAAGAQTNQNAFSNVKVGTTTVEADNSTDTLELAAGTNVVITPDATNDKITISLGAEVETITGAAAKASAAKNEAIAASAPKAHTHLAADLPNSTTAAKGVVQLSTSTTSTSTTTAATPSAVKSVKDSFDVHEKDNLNHVTYAGAPDMYDGDMYCQFLPSNPTSYIEGMAFSFKAPPFINTTTGMVAIGNLSLVPMKKSNGTTVDGKTFTEGSIYTLRYNGTSFILQGEGSELTDTDVTAFIQSVNDILNS